MGWLFSVCVAIVNGLILRMSRCGLEEPVEPMETSGAPTKYVLAFQAGNYSGYSISDIFR